MCCMRFLLINSRFIGTGRVVNNTPTAFTAKVEIYLILHDTVTNLCHPWQKDIVTTVPLEGFSKEIVFGGAVC